MSELDQVTLTSRAFHHDALGPFTRDLAALAGKDLVLPMNTGAEDDSRSTPIFAFSRSSARAIPLAAHISRPASASRAQPFISSSA